jgi:hypothetical protein
MCTITDSTLIAIEYFLILRFLIHLGWVAAEWAVFHSTERNIGVIEGIRLTVGGMDRRMKREISREEECFPGR